MRRIISLTVVTLLGSALLAVSWSEARDEKKADKKLSAQEFVTKASAAGLAEGNLSNLAKDRASRAEVKHFAEHMVKDHTKANMELLQLANTKSLRVAPQMDDQHRRLADRLVTLKGDEFDREYMTGMVKDHEEAVALFSSAEKGLDDKDLQSWVSKTLPTLREHLDMARKTAGQGGRDKDKDKDKTTTKDKDK